VSPLGLASGPLRRVAKVKRLGSGSQYWASVTFEPIDISHGERHMDEEAAALFKAGWRTA
jgi:hypothetical protein